MLGDKNIAPFVSQISLGKVRFGSIRNKSNVVDLEKSILLKYSKNKVEKI